MPSARFGSRMHDVPVPKVDSVQVRDAEHSRHNMAMERARAGQAYVSAEHAQL